ncbi:hypothetical protein [Kibdelosporangium philippinense]|uniref:hypothetical protein n=1 Tax=Kibdelosporangium philippinense TaxID=211113 RepID=UPI00360BC402
MDSRLEWLMFLADHPELLPGPVACSHATTVHYGCGRHCTICGASLHGACN